MEFDYTEQFEQMRPYFDSEQKEAVVRLTSDPLFKRISEYIYPETPLNEAIKNLRGFNSITEFQLEFMHYAVNQVIKNSSDGLTVEGLEKLDKHKPYLFVANHRDIVLDSAIMQLALVEADYKTSQITFGSNLMINQFVIDFGKLNKMFTIYRGGSKIQMYRNALLHSAYIRHVICDQKESVWIAQRNGRTKNGNDKTQSALIKMFIGTDKQPLQSLVELNIVPVAISYEWEPCGQQKVAELFHSRDKEYQKKPGEDLDSILSGILNPKGRIHLSFGKPVNTFLENYTPSNNDIADDVAQYIDNEIYNHYKLYPNNYVAYDLVNQPPTYTTQYSPEQKEQFLNTMQKQLEWGSKSDMDLLKQMYLNMYANPVKNWMEGQMRSRGRSHKPEI
jgi:hypothetical protein